MQKKLNANNLNFRLILDTDRKLTETWDHVALFVLLIVRIYKTKDLLNSDDAMRCHGYEQTGNYFSAQDQAKTQN